MTEREIQLNIELDDARARTNYARDEIEKLKAENKQLKEKLNHARLKNCVLVSRINKIKNINKTFFL